MLNIKKFFEKLRKNKKEKNKEKNNCKEILQEFLESDIQGSELFLDEIKQIIKDIKEKKGNKEFVGNSFELTFSIKDVKLFNQFTQEKCKMNLDDFEKNINL